MKPIKHYLTISLIVIGAFSAPAIAQTVAGNDDALFTQAELDSILAPIALYPDSVLSHVLISATYPLEVIQAARWSRDNPGLDGELAVAAVEDFDWDPSVKALTAFPELLERMDEDIEWTQQIGDAFLIQEESVVASIQALRDRAYNQGHLQTNDHIRVVREERVIYIEPVRTRTVYIPYYDPHVVYGRWWWDAYPPYHWRHPRYYGRIGNGISFYWGSGFQIAPTFYFSSFHWSRNRVVVVNHHHYYDNHYGHRNQRQYFHSGREVANYREARHWRHDPHHRRGVNYRHRVQDNRFVENAARQTHRASSGASNRSINRQRAVGDQRRWASEQRESLNLRQSRAESPQATRSQATRSQARANRAPSNRTDRVASSRSVDSSRAVRQTRNRAEASVQNQARRVQRSNAQVDVGSTQPRVARSRPTSDPQATRSRSTARAAQRSISRRPDESSSQRVAATSAREPVTGMRREPAPLRSQSRSQRAVSQPRMQQQSPRQTIRTEPRTQPQQRAQRPVQQARRQVAPARQSQRQSARPSREREPRTQDRRSRSGDQRRQSRD